MPCRWTVVRLCERPDTHNDARERPVGQGQRTRAKARIRAMSVDEGTAHKRANGRRPALGELQDELVAEYEAEFGPIPEELMEEARAAWVK
jgi:hypothetical protein